MANPIEMPVPLPVNSKKFDLTHSDTITPVGSGHIQTITRLKRPFWVAEYSTPPLREERYQAMVAFLDSLEGSMNTFIGYDPRRPNPLKHMGQVSPWGTATASSGSYTNSTLTLTFQNAISLSIGDYIQVTIGLAVYLFRAREAKGPATAMAIKVSPRPPDFTGNRPARLGRAGCEMKLIGRPQWSDSVDTYPTVTFQAVQYIERNTA